jgi:hypothetical protein
MLNQIPKVIPRVVLLVALLTAFVVSSVSAFAAKNICICNFPKEKNGCVFDKKTSQCVNTSCPGVCF